MHFLVLGPLQVRLRERPATPTARKHRQLLSLLLLNAGHTICVGDLIRGLWDGTSPRSAHITLQTYIAHLRKQIATGLDIDAHAAKEILVTTDSGYLLDASAGYFDLHEYHDLRRDGANLLASRVPEQAFEALRKALSHWRGRAFADVQPSRVLAAEFGRLEESKIRTVQLCADAALRLGRDREQIEELSDLCDSHPLNENLHLANMVALYRCGLRTDALRTFRRLRDETVTQLGLEPTTMIQRLHEAILRSDDDLLRVSQHDPFGVCRSLVGPPARVLVR